MNFIALRDSIIQPGSGDVRSLTPDRIAIILQANQQVVCKEENRKFTPKTERNSEFDKIINKQLLEKMSTSRVNIAENSTSRILPKIAKS
jgi:hypothetical protein